MNFSRFSPGRFTLLCLLTLTLTACGGGGGNDNPAPNPNVPVEPDPATPQQPAADPTEVGRPTGASVSATIGGLGGSLTSADGRLAVHVPAGALSEDTELSLLPIENKAHGGRGGAYRLAPEGLRFALPVQLVFSYGAEDLAGTAAEALGVAFQRVNGTWQWAGTPQLDPHGRTITVETDHFSDWSLVAGLQLQPRTATVKTREALTLRVVDCYPAPADDDGLVPLGMRCDDQPSDDELVPLWFVREWAVNGVAGGSGAAGTVSKTGHATGRFTAPGQVPNPDTVAVSARVDQGRGPQLLLAADVRIVDEEEQPDYTGTIELSSDSYRFTARVNWTLFEDLPSGRTYLPSGTITFSYVDREDCSGPFTVPIATGTPPNERAAGYLLVYPETSVIFPKQHVFLVTGDGPDPCDPSGFEHGAREIMVAPHLTCPGVSHHAFADENRLSGSFSCPGVENVSWTFERTSKQ